MTQEEMELILSSGSLEEEIAELLRKQANAEAEGDATRGREYGTQAGRVYVANPYQAVADMFIRGKAEKKAKTAEDEAKAKRAERDAAVRVFMEGAMGRNLEPIQVGVNRVGRDPSGTSFPAPPAPAAAPSASAGVSAPVPPPTAAPQTPAPQMGAAPPAAPPPRPPAPPAAPAPAPKPPGGIVDPATGLPIDSVEALTKLLRGNRGGATGSW
jgi:hypothetical protein